MVRNTSVAWLGLVALAASASAQQSTPAPTPPAAKALTYFVCFASPTPSRRVSYVSGVFEDKSHVGKTAIQAAFRKYLVDKYDYGGEDNQVQCPGGLTAREMEDIKHDRVHQMAVVETNWRPAP